MHGVERKRRQGKRSTHALYARVGVREFFAADRRHPQLHVELPDGTRYDDIYFADRRQRRPVDLRRQPAAAPHPGRRASTPGSAVYARRRMGTAGMLFSMARMSGDRPAGRARGAPTSSHDLDALTVIADEPLPFQVDGDALDARDKVSFRSVPSGHPGRRRDPRLSG